MNLNLHWMTGTSFSTCRLLLIPLVYTCGVRPLSLPDGMTFDTPVPHALLDDILSDHPTHTNSSLASSIDTRVAHRRIVLLVSQVSIFLLLAYAAIVYAISRNDLQLANSNDARTVGRIQFLCNSVMCLSQVQSTTIISTSYNVAIDVGLGATGSGLLISCIWLLWGIGVFCGKYFLDQWPHPRRRKCVITCTLLSAASSILYVIGASALLERLHAWRIVFMFGSRIIIGFLNGLLILITTQMVLRVTPSDEIVVYSIAKSWASTIGIAIGPLLAFCTTDTLGFKDIHHQAAAPVVVVTCLQFCLLIYSITAIPEDLEALIARKLALESLAKEAEAHTATHVVSETSCSSALGGNSDHEHWLRPHVVSYMEVFWHGIALSTCRACLIASLEAATSLIFELEFHFGVVDVSLFVTSCFLVAAPLSVVLRSLQKYCQGDDSSMLSALTLLCCASTILLFQRVSLSLAGSPHQSFYVIMMADVLIFASGYLASGLAEGVALKYALPGGFYSGDMYATLALIMNGSVGRFVGPVVARSLVAQSRDAYAVWQLLFSFMMLCSTVRMKSCVHALESST